MATVTFVGMCGGTLKKHSTKKNVDYFITRFSEFPSLKTFEVFGDLGLSESAVARQYTLEGDIVGMQNVTVRAGSEPVKTSPK